MGIAAFLMTSCCNKQENKGNCEGKGNCKDKKEQCDKHQRECDHHGQRPGVCPEMMADFDAIVNALVNWDNLDEEQRAEAINMAKTVKEKKEAMEANMPKGDCCKEGKDMKKEECKKHEGGCKHEEGKKCDGKHEGCKNEGGCKHEEGKKCDGK